jgi:hypothetical protein
MGDPVARRRSTDPFAAPTGTPIPQGASLRAVNPNRDLRAGSAVSVGRLLSSVVLLLGFIAMHGPAATNGDGTHHSPLGLAATPGVHSTISATISAGAMTGDGPAEHGTARALRAAQSTLADTGQQGGDAEDSHPVTVGSLIALCGLVVLALTLPRRGILTARVREVAALRHLGAMRPGHPPPRRSPRISLCVLRV